MDNKYTFSVEERDVADRQGRNIVVYATYGNQSHGLPSLNESELQDLVETIQNYLK